MGFIGMLVLFFSFNINTGLGPVKTLDCSIIKKMFLELEYDAVIPYRSQRTNQFQMAYDFNPEKAAVSKVNHLPIDLLGNQLTESIPVDLRDKAKNVVKGVMKVSKQLQIDPIFLLSTIWTESTFKEKIHSHKGARGYMQLMPVTKRFLKRSINKEEYISIKETMSGIKLSDDAKDNIILGAYYLKLLKGQFKDSHVVLAAYNMGPTWARQQINDKKNIGYSNDYVNKIKKKYKQISTTLAKL